MQKQEKKDQQQLAFSLFSQGKKPRQIIKENLLDGVCLKTLYNWHTTWRFRLEETSLKTLVREPIVVPSEDLKQWENWHSQAIKNCVAGSIQHRAISNELCNRLLAELKNPDLDFKAIAILSNSISIHAKLEMAYGFYNMLNPDHAIKVLESYGYNIVSSVSEETDDPETFTSND